MTLINVTVDFTPLRRHPRVNKDERTYQLYCKLILFLNSVTCFYLDNQFSIVFIVYVLFGCIHRLCPHKHNFHFFSGDAYTDGLKFRYRHVHVLLILRIGRFRLNFSKCSVMYWIVYHGRFSIIGICW